MHKCCGWVVAILGTLLTGCFPLTCGRAPAASRFGSYPDRPGYIQVATGERFPVYRIKYWRFADSTSSALQLEYEPPVSVADTAAVRAYAHTVWPVFLPYVRAAGVRAAIVTATNLQRERSGPFSAVHLHHFGIVVQKDSLGRWFFDGETTPAPTGRGSGGGIFQSDGTRLPIGHP